MKITMTFDNGPDPHVTPLVLDVLARHGIASTFFVLGDKLRDRRHLAERAHAEGHWIGNHTYNHLVPLGLSAEPGIAAREIEETQALIGDLTHERHFFRPFGGGGVLDERLLNREAADVLTRGGYTCVLWNAVPCDWSHPSTWIQTALRFSREQDHTVLVLHDLNTEAMAHLERFIETAADQGATFVQDFPRSCIPMERGIDTGTLTEYIADAAC